MKIQPKIIKRKIDTKVITRYNGKREEVPVWELVKRWKHYGDKEFEEEVVYTLTNSNVVARLAAEYFSQDSSSVEEWEKVYSEDVYFGKLKRLINN